MIYKELKNQLRIIMIIVYNRMTINLQVYGDSMNYVCETVGNSMIYLLCKHDNYRKIVTTLGSYPFV